MTTAEQTAVIPPRIAPAKAWLRALELTAPIPNNRALGRRACTALRSGEPELPWTRAPSESVCSMGS
jgi:hypothetical protein